MLPKASEPLTYTQPPKCEEPKVSPQGHLFHISPGSSHTQSPRMKVVHLAPESLRSPEPNVGANLAMLPL